MLPLKQTISQTNAQTGYTAPVSQQASEIPQHNYLTNSAPTRAVLAPVPVLFTEGRQNIEERRAEVQYNSEVYQQVRPTLFGIVLGFCIGIFGNLLGWIALAIIYQYYSKQNDMENAKGIAYGAIASVAAYVIPIVLAAAVLLFIGLTH